MITLLAFRLSESRNGFGGKRIFFRKKQDASVADVADYISGLDFKKFMSDPPKISNTEYKKIGRGRWRE